MTPNQLVEVVKDLLDRNPEVLAHLQVWAGLEKPFACSDIEREDALRLADGLGLITIEHVPTVTRYGHLAIEFSESKLSIHDIETDK